MAMWRPAERIKYVAEPGRWPTRKEAKQARLFQPLALGRNGHCQLNDRTWVPAMVPWRATEDGVVTPDIIDWYRRFAEGRPGAIVVEATGIRDIPSGPLLRIGHDRFLPGLRTLTDTVRKASGGYTRLFIQIIDFLNIRRRPKRDRYLNEFIRITSAHIGKLNLSSDSSEAEVRAALLKLSDEELIDVLDEREWEALQYGARERVTDTRLPHIRDLPQKLPGLFSDAAERARKAGFDGVELHYAHAYTMASFLSAINTREDGYGGSLEGRVRLPVELFEAVRRRVGDDYVVGCRMLTEDCLNGGMETSEAAFFASRLAGHGMDFISLSRGGKFEDAKQPKVGWAAYPYTGPSGYECMPSYYSDAKGHSAAICSLPPRCAPRFAPPVSTRPRLPWVASTASSRPRRCWRTAKETSPGWPVRPWPIPTGSKRSEPATAARCSFAYTPTTAKPSISAIVKSPANYGTARTSRNKTSSSQKTANAAS